VFFATLISSACDWIKEKQFLNIRDEVNNAQVMVYRGHSGNPCSFLVRDLVVGDVIDI
jgi:magnesium-transporting ATPase (P-type)